MNVKLVKVEGKRGKYYLTFKPRANSKREKKIIRSIALALCGSHPLIGSGPEEGSSIYLDVIPVPAISEKDYKVALATHKEPPLFSAYEVKQNMILDRRVDENLEYKRAVASNAIARQFGLHKIIPKNLRAKFTCRCGVSYKKKYKLLRHQEYCTVLAEEREVFANVEAIRKLHESESNKKKKKRTAGQPVSDKSNRRNKARKTTAKTSKR